MFTIEFVVQGILTAIFISLIAASIWWLISYRCRWVNVKFSPKLYLRCEKKKGEIIFPIKVKYANVGRNTLVDIKKTARINHLGYYWFASLGKSDFDSWLLGTKDALKGNRERYRRYDLMLAEQEKEGVAITDEQRDEWQRRKVRATRKFVKKNPAAGFSRVLNITLDDNIKEFYAEKYPDKTVGKKGADKTLTLWDLFEEFPNSLELRLHVYGYDSFLGITRTFYSKVYTFEDVCPKGYRPTMLDKSENTFCETAAKMIDKVRIKARLANKDVRPQISCACPPEVDSLD